MQTVILQNERLLRTDVYDNYNPVSPFSFQCHPRPHRAKKRMISGFSLVEVLAVTCLIGIFGSIALGWYGGDYRAQIERVTQQRNAQEIVSFGVYATMSGAEFVVKGDKQATVVNLIAGVIGQEGQWKGRLFRLDNLMLADLPGALTFVTFDSDLLLYNPTGQPP
jgi:type II secretory pathway pseudopilin PulG